MTTIEIGRVGRAHGLRGEVRIQPYWEGSDTLEHVDTVLLARKGGTPREHRIASCRPADKAYLVRFEGVTDRGAAEALLGLTVSVPRTALPPLLPGEYYLSDLVGAEVYGPAGLVGTVVDIHVHPTIDTLVIRRTDGALVEQPLVPPWLGSVDAAKHRVDLTSLDGFF